MGLSVNQPTSLAAGAGSIRFGISARPADDPSLGSFPAMLQSVTSQLLAFFRATGFSQSVSEELVHPVMEGLSAQVQEALQWPCKRVPMPTEIHIGQLKLDLDRRLFWRGDRQVHLSPKEFDLLTMLMRNAGGLLPHVKLLRAVWGLEYGQELEYLRTCICGLRKKIENDPANPEYILSEPWVGYRFRAPDPEAIRCSAFVGSTVQHTVAQ